MEPRNELPAGPPSGVATWPAPTRTPARVPARHLEHARLLARLLDDAIPIPGTSYRIGLDPLLGLVPGLGDLLGALLSAWILVLASRLGAPRAVLVRMALNVAVDTVVGIVPGVGDVFDAAWKSNARNVALIEAWQAQPGRTERASAARVVGLVLLVLLLAAAVAYAGWHLVAWAARGIGVS
jgi:hypothetical protein